MAMPVGTRHISFGCLSILTFFSEHVAAPMEDETNCFENQAINAPTSEFENFIGAEIEDESLEYDIATKFGAIGVESGGLIVMVHMRLALLTFVAFWL